MFSFFFLSLPRFPKRYFYWFFVSYTQTEDTFFLPLCSPQPITPQRCKRDKWSLNIYILVTLFDTEKSYFYFCGSLSSSSLLFLPNLTHYCLHSIISMKKKEREIKKKKTGLGKQRPWILSWNQFHGPARQVWARTLSTSDWTLQEANLQVTNLTLKQPSLWSPHSPRCWGVHPCQSLFHSFHTSSSTTQWHWVIDEPNNSSYLPFFSYKKTGSLGILLFSSLQNLSGSQSIIIGTGLPTFIV